jgi:SSS family solute:Na+ symporter
MFIMGFFWKKTTSNAALFATIGGFILSVLFKFLPNFINLEFLNGLGFSVPNADGVYEIPFIDRMGFVFLLCLIGMYFISMRDIAKGEKPKGLDVDASMFKTKPLFTAGALIIVLILVALYAALW